MPWVLKDYTSEVLDLQNLASFRDLAKPIGALGDPKRLSEARERYSQTPEDCERFLYGTHYSCPGYVVGFHVRSHPHWMIKF
jgi:factor associated with neutral sphingomyelinase activation